MWPGLCECVVLWLGVLNHHRGSIQAKVLCKLEIATHALPSIFLQVVWQAEHYWICVSLISFGELRPGASSLAGIFWEWMRSSVAWTLIIKGGYQVREGNEGNEYGLEKERITNKGIKTESNLRGQTQDILSRQNQDLPPFLDPP